MIAIVINQNIIESLESNYMPYSAHVILNRALPEIDGFKPSQRRILYTMYQMGLLNGNRKKSQGIVGRTMFLHPHGDQSIYETLVRMARDNESLLTPYIDSKGNFGKIYSRDMKFASARYTEAKLTELSKELFKDINKDNVDMIDSYDGSMKEPRFLPTTFPNILTNASSGTAVGMASNIASFNLNEVIDFTIAFLTNKNAVASDYITAPDFPTGASIVKDDAMMKTILDTGRGSFKIRAKYHFTEDNIIFTEIPYTTTFETIIDKVTDLVKDGTLKEIVDIDDIYGIDTKGISITVRNNTDKELLVQKLYKLTSLEDSYSCNFNLIVDGSPKVLGVKEIIRNWIIFRVKAMKRAFEFDLNKKDSQRHMLYALKKIALDIDKAIEIIRATKKNSEVEKNLMKQFKIDQSQAEFVSNIKLKYLNQEYLLSKIDEIDTLTKEIDRIESIISDKKKLAKEIIKELKEIKNLYGEDRKTDIIEISDESPINIQEALIDNYNVKVFVTREGYLKKIPLTSLRGNFNLRVKDGDEIISEFETTNLAEVIFFTDKRNAYKKRLHEIEDSKPSLLGEFVPSFLELDDEELIHIHVTDDFNGDILFGFDDGKVSRIEVKAYQTKQNRQCLANAYADKKVVYARFLDEGENIDIMAISDNDKAMVMNTYKIGSKASRTSAGVWFMRCKEGTFVKEYMGLEHGHELEYYRSANPSIGKNLKK